MNKILFHSLTYPPESVSTGLLVSKIVEEFKVLGFNIEVLASSPQYIHTNIEEFNNSKKGIITREQNGIKVHYIISKKRKFRKFSRFFQWISFNLKTINFLYKNKKKYKELFVFSYPPTMNITCLISSKIFKIKTHYSVWELYPEIAIKLGKIKSKLFTYLFKKLDNFAMRSVENVIVNSDSLRDYLVSNRKINPDKIKIISHFSPNKSSTSFPDYKVTKIMYAGNLGVPQNLSKFIDYFNENFPENWRFIVFGSGEEFEKIKMLRNYKVEIKEYVNREELERMTVDIPFALVSLHSDILFEGFPGKTFDYLKMNKILINFSNKNSVVSKFVDENGLGLNIDASESLKATFNFSLLQDFEVLKKIEENIKNFNKKNNSPKIVAEKYIKLVSTFST